MNRDIPRDPERGPMRQSERYMSVGGEHEAGVSRMLNAERKAVEERGGAVLGWETERDQRSRFQTSVELHQSVLGRPLEEGERIELARSLGLPVVDGKVRFNDLTVSEYVDGRRQERLLEYPSRGARQSAKNAAGFVTAAASGKTIGGGSGSSANTHFSSVYQGWFGAFVAAVHLRNQPASTRSTFSGFGAGLVRRGRSGQSRGAKKGRSWKPGNIKSGRGHRPEPNIGIFEEMYR